MDELKEIRKHKMEELGQKVGEEVTGEKPVEITDESFDQVLKDSPAIVVDFWAPWCMPCLALSPVIERLAKKYAGKVVFGKLNIDENRKIAARFGITAIPTLLFFKKGKQIDRVIGTVAQAVLEQKIKKLLE
jgi:thioredoxin 1